MGNAEMVHLLRRFFLPLNDIFFIPPKRARQLKISPLPFIPHQFIVAIYQSVSKQQQQQQQDNIDWYNQHRQEEIKRE
jgi:hypothetical protein